MDFNSELFAGIMGFCVFVVGPLFVSIELHRLNKKLNLRNDYDVRIDSLEREVAMLISHCVNESEDDKQ